MKRSPSAVTSVAAETFEKGPLEEEPGLPHVQGRLRRHVHHHHPIAAQIEELAATGRPHRLVATFARDLLSRSRARVGLQVDLSLVPSHWRHKRATGHRARTARSTRRSGSGFKPRRRTVGFERQNPEVPAKGVIEPRISKVLPVGCERARYHRLISRQDLFGSPLPSAARQYIESIEVKQIRLPSGVQRGSNVGDKADIRLIVSRSRSSIQMCMGT